MIYDPFASTTFAAENYRPLYWRFACRYCDDLNRLWDSLPVAIERHALADVWTWKDTVMPSILASLDTLPTERIQELLLSPEVLVTVLHCRRGKVRLLREGNHRIDVLRQRGVETAAFRTVHVFLSARP